MAKRSTRQARAATQLVLPALEQALLPTVVPAAAQPPTVFKHDIPKTKPKAPWET